MKKLFTFVCGAAIMLSTYSPAQAQNGDTTLARYDVPKKEMRQTAKVVQKKQKKDISTSQGESNNEQLKQADHSGFVVPPEIKDKNSEASGMNGKVGPNGEELFMKGGKYYYLNKDGKKVKVKAAAIKDGPKQS